MSMREYLNSLLRKSKMENPHDKPTHIALFAERNKSPQHVVFFKEDVETVESFLRGNVEYFSIMELGKHITVYKSN